MKSNKWGIRVTFYISIIALLGAIFLKCWWQNLCFAILGSSVLSFTICVINYLTLRRDLVMTIVTDVYRCNIDVYSNLYSSKKDITLEHAERILGLLNEKFYLVYLNNHTLHDNLFWFNKRTKSFTMEIEHLIEQNLQTVTNIDSFIEMNIESASKNTKNIYADLVKLLDDATPYHLTLKMARKYHIPIYSSEEDTDINLLKTKAATQYEKTLK